MIPVGLTESLTTDLSRIRGAYVVARNTAFTYKGKPLDVKTIGRGLNVRYVLEGSVQRGGNRDLGEKTFKNIARPVRVYAHAALALAKKNLFAQLVVGVVASDHAPGR